MWRKLQVNGCIDPVGHQDRSMSALKWVLLFSFFFFHCRRLYKSAEKEIGNFPIMALVLDLPENYFVTNRLSIPVPINHTIIIWTLRLSPPLTIRPSVKWRSVKVRNDQKSSLFYCYLYQFKFLCIKCDCIKHSSLKKRWPRDIFIYRSHWRYSSVFNCWS